MDWDLFWNAFGAIGTTVGTMATAVVALLTYRQYSLSKSTKLKIKMEVQTTTKSSGLVMRFFVVDFINTGIIDLYVNRISIEVQGEYYCIGDFFQFKDKNDDHKTIFPVKVTKDQMVSVKILDASLKRQIDFIKRQNDIDNIKCLTFVITDGKGKEYKKKVRI